MKVWHSFTETRAGYLYSLSDSISVVETQRPEVVVPVADGTMIVASDYSGQHKAASHEAYSFLVTTDRALNEWLPSLWSFRQKWLPDNRRISFKKLNEPVRWRALPAFLKIAEDLRGNLITILVDRRIGSFMSGGSEMAIKAFPDCFPTNASAGTIEKMLRLASFVALILSGLRREDQMSNWISDHDEALDHHDKREQFARLASYLTFGVTGWRQPADHLFSTTESPTAPCWSEDLAAIADLVAGAYCQLSNYLPSFFGEAGEKTWQVNVAPEQIESERARVVGDWLARSKGSLKHVLLRLEQDKNGRARSSAQAFAGRCESSE